MRLSSIVRLYRVRLRAQARAGAVRGARASRSAWRCCSPPRSPAPASTAPSAAHQRGSSGRCASSWPRAARRASTKRLLGRGAEHARRAGRGAGAGRARERDRPVGAGVGRPDRAPIRASRTSAARWCASFGASGQLSRLQALALPAPIAQAIGVVVAAARQAAGRARAVTGAARRRAAWPARRGALGPQPDGDRAAGAMRRG